MKTPPSILLTVAIPAYNVENYIAKALMPFLDNDSDNLEILVINDGSTDDTKEIVTNLSQKNHSIKLINKTNGGHGSAINTAIANAHGKYFKLLDGDDWFDKKEFDRFFKKLQKETADIILTEHVEIYPKSHKTIISHYYDSITPDTIFNIEDISFKKYGPTLPSTTIKTSILKKSHFKLDENCFYVDQEYNYITYTKSNSLIKYNTPLYCYRLEQEGQSMSKASLSKNYKSHEKVCLRLIKETSSSNLQEKKRLHLYNNIILPLCNLQYEIIIKYCHSRKAFLSFDQKLKKYPPIYNHPAVVGNIIKFHRKTKGYSIPLDPLFSKIGEKIKLS